MTTPRLLSATDAAAYLGISVTTLRGLSFRRKVLGARRLYAREDLDAFVDSLPSEGEESENSCDEVFG